MKPMLDIDWEAKIKECPENEDQQWNKYKTKCCEAELKCIPKNIVRTNNKFFTIPLDRKSLGKIKKKKRLWNKYIQTKSGEVYQNYCRLRNQIRRITRKAKKTYEQNLAKQVKTNPKRFWSYANAKTKS